MKKEKIVELIKFHCSASKDNLLKFSLPSILNKLPKNLKEEIENSFYYLEQNLCYDLTGIADADFIKSINK